MSWRGRVVGVVAVVAVLAAPVWGRLVHIFEDPNAAGGDGFGSGVQSVLLLGNGTVVAGAPLATVDDRQAAGLVYVFDVGGALRHTLRSPNPVANGRFGAALAVAGADLLVGAPGDDATGESDVGEVYRIDGTTFVTAATYRPPQLQTGMEFGSTLLVDGGTLYVAAANSAFTQASGAGVVHALDLTTGTTLRSFLPPVDVDDGAFGEAMLVAAGSLIVGAPGVTVSGDDQAGLVYFLDPAASGTVVQRSIQATTPIAGGAFGSALALVGSSLLVGSPQGEPLGDPATGVVYVVDPATGVTRSSFGPFDVVDGADFGRTIVVGSDSVSIAADGGTADGQTGAGQVYQLDPTTFAVQRIVTSPTTATDAAFGAALAAAGTQLLVGEPGAASGTPTLYLFDSAAGGPGGGGHGGTTTTVTTTTLPGNCTVAASFVSAQCQLDALGTTVTTDALGTLGTRLLAALGRAQTKVQAAQAAATPRASRRALRAAVTSLRAFQRRLAHGKVGFAQSSVLGLLAGGAHQSLLQLLATT